MMMLFQRKVLHFFLIFAMMKTPDENNFINLTNQTC